MWSPVHPQPRAAARNPAPPPATARQARFRPRPPEKMITSGLGSALVPTYSGGVTSRRSVVDYGLARRATLASVYAGHTTVADVCDAHPYLLRAAKFHGEPTQDRCPICRKTRLTHVTYVYGDAEYGEFRVYVVEVCQGCGWNHLACSYVLGTGEPVVRRGRRARTSQ